MSNVMRILLLKSGQIKNGIGLHQEDRTDRTGRHAKRWVKGPEAAPEHKQSAKDPEDTRGSQSGYGMHNLEPGDSIYCGTQNLIVTGSLIWTVFNPIDMGPWK